MSSRASNPEFQSLNRDSGCSDLSSSSLMGLGRFGFNPSIGILVVQTKRQAALGKESKRFQSLNRDSGCSDCARGHTCAAAFSSFNPSIGILVVQTRPIIDGQTGHESVSIPQSGFWLFRPVTLQFQAGGKGGFNPSIGILVVQTIFSSSDSPFLRQFQSLNRDSGCSDHSGRGTEKEKNMVSIPQSGFWLFRPTCQSTRRGFHLVSIPQSGFWLFRPRCWCAFRSCIGGFQSLNRDSGCSDYG